MQKQAQLGLIVEGKARTSAVLRLPKIAGELGPIKSGAPRVARRLSHMLHAGYAVEQYEELQTARLILLEIPDCAVRRVIEELYVSDLDFRDLTFILCESWLLIDVLQPLRERGASIATLVRLPTVEYDWFAVEGQAPAVRQIRRFLERNQARAVEIRFGSKPLLFAAELLATVLPIPLLAAAQQALRASGISGNPLSALLDQMAEKMSKDFLKRARTMPAGPLGECSPETVEVHFEHLRRSYAQIAEVVEEQLRWARRRMPEGKIAGGAIAKVRRASRASSA